MRATDGFLLVDKPRGWTSHDVVEHVRRAWKGRKVGHAGTLDPPATGLLVVGIGRCTRLLRFVQDLPKSYEATVVFGVATDTLDAEGAILSREPMPVSEAELRQVLERFVGTILQVPPMVSALRVDGRRLYELAREGREVDRPARRVDVHQITLEDLSPGEYPEAVLRIHCGKGTYVRSLADDIAQALGGRAHLSALRRTAVGSLDVGNACSTDEIASSEAPVLAPSEGLRDLPAVLVSREQASAVAHGMSLAPPFGKLAADGEGEICRLLDEDERLLAVYRRSGRRLVPEVVLS